MRQKIQIYGQAKLNTLDQDQLQLHQSLTNASQLQTSLPALRHSWTSCTFNHQLHQYWLTASGNQMQVFSLTDLRAIDFIATSHQSDILTLDIAPVTKNIVSYSKCVIQSENTRTTMNHSFIVHGLADLGYLNGIDKHSTIVFDQLKGGSNLKRPSEQALKWIEYWKCDENLLAIQGFLNVVALSPIGDVLLLGGHQFLSVWTRDTNLSSHSYSMQVLLSRNPPNDILCPAIQDHPVDQVVQAEFSFDGRLILCLEEYIETKSKNQRFRRVKVYYNSDIQRRVRFDRLQDYCPKNHDVATKLAKQTKQGGMRQTKLSGLSNWEMPEQFKNEQLVQMKQLQHPNQKHRVNRQLIIPVSFLTLSERGRIMIWVEDMLTPQLSDLNEDQEFDPVLFSCIQQVTLPIQQELHYDLSFVSLESDLRANVYEEFEVDDQSMILNVAELDYVHKFKQQNSALTEELFEGILSQIHSEYSQQTSLDLFLVVFKDQLQLFEIKGLRSLSASQSTNMEVLCRDSIGLGNMERPLGQQYWPKYILACQQESLTKATTCNTPNGGIYLMGDILGLVAITSSGMIIKYVKDFGDSNSQWRANKIIGMEAGIYQKGQIVDQVESNSDLGFTATLVQKEDKSLVFLNNSVSMGLVTVNQKNLQPFSTFLTAHLSSAKIQKIRWSSYNLILLYTNTKQIDVMVLKRMVEVFKKLVNQTEKVDLRDLEKVLVRKYKKSHHQTTGITTLSPSPISFQIEGEVLDFQVLETRISHQNLNLVMTQNLVVVSTQEVKVLQLVITFNADDHRVILTSSDLQTDKIPESKQIIKVLNSQTDSGPESLRDYNPQTPSVLYLLLTVNNSNQLEICLIRVCMNRLALEFSKVLPDQGSLQQSASNASFSRSNIQFNYKSIDVKLEGRLCDSLCTVLVRDKGKGQYYVYIVETGLQIRYKGFIDLVQAIDFSELDKNNLLKQGFQIDYQLINTQNGPVMVIACLDQVICLVYSQVQNEWVRVMRSSRITGLHLRLIDQISIHKLIDQSFLVVINNNYVRFFDNYFRMQGQEITNYYSDAVLQKIRETDGVQIVNAQLPITQITSKWTISQYSSNLQKSKNLHCVEVLKEMFFGGRGDLVMRLMVKLNQVLREQFAINQQNQKNTNYEDGRSQILVSNIINMSVHQLLSLIDSIIDTQIVQKEVQPTPQQNYKIKQQNQKKGDFDFFGGSDEDDLDLMDFDRIQVQKKDQKEVKKEKATDNQLQNEIQKEFDQSIDELLGQIARIDPKTNGDQWYSLLEFLMVFKNLQSKEFFSDEMAKVLLTEVFFQTEKIDEKALKEIGLMRKDEEENDGRVRKLLNHEIYAQMYGEKELDRYGGGGQTKTVGDLSKIEKWDSRKCALALFTVNQDVVIDELKGRFDLENNASWDLVRDLCMAVWVKEPYKLRQIVEWISKVAYKQAGEQNMINQSKGQAIQSQAEQTSLWYLLINKKNVLISLFEKEKASGGDKVAQMLSQDFSQDRWQKAALKNALVLRQKQRYLLSSTFFILGGDIQSALQVIRQSLNDPILAVLTLRMLELQQPNNNEIGLMLSNVYDEFFIQRGKEVNDIYLQSIGLWCQKKFVEAVNILQMAAFSDQSSTSPVGISKLFESDSKSQILVSLMGERSKEKDKENQEGQLMPLVTEGSGLELIRIVPKLQKVPQVTFALKQNQSKSGYGADQGDIFDDFFDNPIQKKEMKGVGQEQKVELIVSQSQLLSQVLQEHIKRSDVANFLVTLRDNREFIDPNSSLQVSIIASGLTRFMKDQVENLRTNPTYFFPENTFYKQIDHLSSFVTGIQTNSKSEQSLKLAGMKNYLRRTTEMATCTVLQDLDGDHMEESTTNLRRYKLELQLDAQVDRRQSLFPVLRRHSSLREIMWTLEEQSLYFLKYIKVSSETISLETDSPQSELNRLCLLQQIVSNLEHHADCLIIWELFQPSQNQQDLNGQVNPDGLEMDVYFKEQQLETNKQTKIMKKQQQNKYNESADFFFDSEEFDGDFGAPHKPYTLNNPKMIKKPSQASLQPANSEHYEEVHRLVVISQEQTEKLCAKLRMSVIFHLALLVVSSKLQKFQLVLEVLSAENLQKTINFDNFKLMFYRQEIHKVQTRISQGFSVSPAELDAFKKLSETIEQANNQIHFQNLKTMLQSLKQTIERRIIHFTSLIAPPAPQSELDQFSYLKKKQKDSVYTEKWEGDMLDALELFIEKQRTSSSRLNESEIRSPDKPSEVIESSQEELQKLCGHDTIVGESLIFVRKWLKFIVLNKTRDWLEECRLSEHIQDDQKEEKRRPYYWLEQNLKTVDYNSKIELLDLQTRQFSQETPKWQININNAKLRLEIEEMFQGLSSQPFRFMELVHCFRRAAKTLEDDCTIFFRTRLSVNQRRLIASHLTSPPSSLTFHLFFKYFFPSEDKFIFFWQSFGVQKCYGKPLYDFYLGLLGKTNSVELDERERIERIRYPSMPFNQDKTPLPQKETKQNKDGYYPGATQSLSQEVFGQGIELFKQRGEQINDFACDNSDLTDNIALGMLTAGIREIPVVNTLIARMRIMNGLQLIDEENLKWDECLHRYDQYEEFMYSQTGHIEGQRNPEIIQTKDEAIVAAVDSLYAETSIFQRSKPIIRPGLLIQNRDIKPPAIWNGVSASLFTAQVSKLEVTHDDYTFSVESHPYLPLYVTGNRRGILCTWKFGQQTDKSLNQFSHQQDPSQADPKRACVKKIAFNLYGDKIMSNNMEGSFTIFQIDATVKRMRKVPLFQLFESVDQRVSDFDLVNGDNVIATVSSKQKSVKIYDTLLPYSFARQAVVMESKQGGSGNIILVNRRKQTILTFNGRTGAMSELDMRMGLNQINQVQLSQSHEVTAACLNRWQDTLITGYKNGHVKIHALDRYYNQSGEMGCLMMKEKIDAFPYDFRTRKGVVQRVRVVEKSGALLSCSQGGILKLLRPSV